MRELEGVLGISHTISPFYYGGERFCLKQIGFAGGRARRSDLQPRAHPPSLHCWQESEGDISIEDSLGQNQSPQHLAVQPDGQTVKWNKEWSSKFLAPTTK